MKILNLLFTFLLATGLSFGQSSFVFVSHDTVVSGAAGTLLSAHAHIKNTSGTTINALCKRVIIFKVIGDTNYFCWGGNCWNPIVDTSLGTETLSPGYIDTAFYGDLNDLNFSTVNDTVRYTVWDRNNTSDSISWVVVYKFSATGINQISLGLKNLLVNAFPDPSDNEVTIQYSLAKECSR